MLNHAVPLATPARPKRRGGFRGPPRSGAMKTIPVMLRLDPADWKLFQQEAKALDLTRAQLIRKIMHQWLEKASKKAK